jgi:hypothetical protein
VSIVDVQKKVVVPLGSWKYWDAAEYFPADRIEKPYVSFPPPQPTTA